MNRAQRIVAAVACFLLASAFTWYNLVFLAGQRSRYFRGFSPAHFFYGVAVPIALLAAGVIILLAERTTPREFSNTLDKESDPAQKPDAEGDEPAEDDATLRLFDENADPAKEAEPDPDGDEEQVDEKAGSEYQALIEGVDEEEFQRIEAVVLQTRKHVLTQGGEILEPVGPQAASLIADLRQRLAYAESGRAWLAKLRPAGVTLIILTAFGLLLILAQYLTDLFGSWLVPYLAVLALVLLAGVLLGFARLLIDFARRLLLRLRGRD